jgi:hypothetical protein
LWILSRTYAQRWSSWKRSPGMWRLLIKLHDATLGMHAMARLDTFLESAGLELLVLAHLLIEGI